MKIAREMFGILLACGNSEYFAVSRFKSNVYQMFVGKILHILIMYISRN